MTFTALAHLVRQNIRRTRRGFVLSVFGIAVGVTSLAFFLALSSGMRGGVLARVFPARQVEVVPPSTSLDTGPLSLLTSLGGGRHLTSADVEALRARPEVEAAFARMRLAFPARATGGAAILGRDIRAELIAEGVDPAAMAGESLGPIPFSDALGSQSSCVSDADCRSPEYCARPLTAAARGDAAGARCELPVPAVISPFILELYNGAIAPQHGLPRVGRFLAGRFRGFTFTAELGASFFGLSRRALAATAPPEPVERRIMLVGIGPRAAQLALTLPLGRVRAWNSAFAGDDAGRELSSLVLELREGADVARLAAAVRALGLELADSGAEKVGLLLTLLTLLFTLVSLAVLAVAATNIAHGFFRQVAERKRELGVMRAVGASARDVMSLVLAEAAVIGLYGGLAGLLVARLGAFAVDLMSERVVPDFPFKPDTWFSFGWPMVAGAILCSVFACVLGAWLPARAAARLDPTEALSTP